MVLTVGSILEVPKVKSRERVLQKTREAKLSGAIEKIKEIKMSGAATIVKKN